MPSLLTTLKSRPGYLVLLAIVLALFAPALFRGLSGDAVVSARGGDVQQQFLGWREYWVTRVHASDWPLWNPYNFAGQPFVGNFQTATLYPPNWLHLALPNHVAFVLSVLVAAHLLLAGALTLRWLTYKGYPHAAATVGAAVFMLSAPVLAKAYPGHITWIAVVAWVPALFWCVDGLVDRGRWKYAWWGAGVVGMMVLAGYPQPVYIAAVGATLYFALILTGALVAAREAPTADSAPGLIPVSRWKQATNAVAGFVVIFAGGAVLSAAQLWPGLEAAGESVRSGGTSWTFATSFSLPLTNLALALAPTALGPPGSGPSGYRGEWLLWEVWPYFGAVALSLAIVGGLSDRSPRRRWAGTLAVIFLLFSLGRYTPAYAWAYEALPGLAGFRVPGRWLLLVAVFVAVLAASGVDGLLKARRAEGRAGLVLAAVAAGLAVVAGLLAFAAPAPWNLGKGALLVSAVLLGGVALLAANLLRWKWALPALLVLTVGELAAFGTRVVTTTATRINLPPAWSDALTRVPPGTRLQIQGGGFANFGLWARVPTLAGYDPFMPRRWVDLIAATQGWDPRETHDVDGDLRPHPAWALLRVSRVIFPDGRDHGFPPPYDPLPQALLVPRAEVVPIDPVRLARLTSPDFDFRERVLLETAPRFPAFTAQNDADPPEGEQLAPLGKATALPTADGDRLEIDVEAGRRSFLLVTDAYAKGWTARRADTGQPLDVMPGNQVARVIPITPGKYRVILEYQPAGWVYGRWVSVAGVGVWLVWGLLAGLRSRRTLRPAGEA